MRRFLILAFLLLLPTSCFSAIAVVQRKNGTTNSLTITSTSAGDSYIGITDSTTSPTSVQTTGGTGDTFTKQSCTLTTTPENMCVWYVKSSHSSGTHMTCTTCGTINAMWFWEWSGTDTSTTIDAVVACSADGFSVPCLQPSGTLPFSNGYSSEGIVAAVECSGSASSWTDTGFSGTSNGFPNGNGAEDGILSSATSITATPDSGCGATRAEYIVGIKAATATQGCVWNIGYFSYGSEISASGNPTVATKIVNVGDLVVVRPWCLTNCTISSVTVGSQSATQTSVAGATGSTAGQPYLYYVLSSTQNGAITTTMNTTGTFTNAQVSYAEFVPTAGCTCAHDVDSILAGAATGATITTPTITPSGAGELLFGFTPVFSHATAIGSPWSCNYFLGTGQTDSCFDGGTVNAWTYILNGSSGATSNNVTQLSSNPWQAILTSFKLTGSGSATTRKGRVQVIAEAARKVWRALS